MDLKENAVKLLSCQNPKVKINFPLRSNYISQASRAKAAKRSKSNEDGWITTKKTKTPKKSLDTKKQGATATKSKLRKGKSSNSKKQVNNSSRPEVIDISDDTDGSDDEPIIRKRSSSRLSATKAKERLRSCDDSLFDTDDSSEN